MPLSSRTFRVAVSSAFSALPDEHGVLYGDVFPKLRALCARHGWRFQAIDLSGGAGLRQAAPFRAVSPPPVYVCVVGERYGYRPLPEAIPAAEFAEIEKRVPRGAAAFLREWYRLDRNAVPEVAILERPEGVFAQPEIWERFVAAPLHALLEEAARGLDLAPEARLKYEASAAEQEIQAALAGKEGAPVHVFCFARVSGGASAERDADARARLEALRRRLRQQLGGNYLEYAANSLGTLVAAATAALSRAAQAEIKRKETAADHEETAQDAWARERGRGFTGRAKPVERVAAYLHGADAHPLVVTGAAGAGKSALLAYSLERYRMMRREAKTIHRTAGATAESVDGRVMLAEVCWRLGWSGPAGYADMVEQFGGLLKAGSAPLVVVLDGLDEWTPLDQARDLDWLPRTVPAGVRLIVCAAAGELATRLRAKVPVENVVEMEPMAPAEGARLLDLWLQEAGRAITPPQRARVMAGFQNCPLSLYLRLAFEQARRWRSNEPGGGAPAAPDIAGQVDQMLELLANGHGRPLVARALGYMAAARQGLAEDELFDLLARDGLVTPAAWPRLCADLRPYLVERAADGVTLFAFAHREVRDAVAQAFLAGSERRARHQALANYFAECSYPARRWSELARQQALGGLWGPLEATLTSLEFADAKARAGLVWDLIEDHRVAEICWRAEKPIPPPWRDWSRFLAAEARTIEAGIGKFPQMLFQQAFNHAREGRVASAAQALIKQGRQPQQPWFERVNRPEFPPGPECRATLEGAGGPLAALALAEGGALAVAGGADGAVRVWRAASGACLRVMRGHSGSVMALAVAGANRDRVVSASWDGTARIWDLASGECLQVLSGYPGPVVSVAAVGPERVAAGAIDGALRVWDLDGRCVAALLGHKDRINSILALPGGRIASASDDGSVQVWGADGTRLGTLSGHGGPVLHLDWIAGAGAGALAASCQSGKIVLWDLETSKTRDILAGHGGAVAGAAALDKARAVSWSYDNTLRYWSLVDGSQLSVLRRHAAPVTAVEVLADGRVLSASQDGTLRLWDAAGESAGVLNGHRSWVTALAAEGGTVVSAGRDGTLRLWDVDAASGEGVGRAVETPPEIARARQVTGVYVVDAQTAISATAEPESYQLWDLAEGRCTQSAEGASEAGQQLRDRIRPWASVAGPSYRGGAGSQRGFSIRGAEGSGGAPAAGLSLTRERQRENGLLDYASGALAFYPVVAEPSSWTVECDSAIAFDARTREPHVVKAHHEALDAAETEAAVPAGGLRSLVRKLWGRGDQL
jgi:WD40 repeat protein